MNSKLEIRYGDCTVKPLSVGTLNRAVKNLRKYHYTREPYSVIRVTGFRGEPLAQVTVLEDGLIVESHGTEIKATTGVEAMKALYQLLLLGPGSQNPDRAIKLEWAGAEVAPFIVQNKGGSDEKRTPLKDIAIPDVYFVRCVFRSGRVAP